MGLRKDIIALLSKKLAQLEALTARMTYCKKSGKFYRLPPQKRNALSIKLRKLTSQVGRLNWQTKLATVGGTIAALSNAQQATAQSTLGPFVQQRRAFNPLRYPIRKSEQIPTSVDLDNDGDYDIVVGEKYGYIRIYLNEGSSSSPAFSELFALDQTMTPVNMGGYASAPAFADLNSDGKLDLIFGTHGASTDRIFYFVGNGGIPGDALNPLLFTQQTGPWDDVAKTGNPFDGLNPVLDFTPNQTPTFVNFDGDGDMDLLLGHNYYYQPGIPPNIDYYENDGKGNFVQGTFATNPPMNVSAYDRPVPKLADIDQDGNLDLVVGSYQGNLRFFKGNGISYNEQTGPWDPILKTGNPFNGIAFASNSAPAFVDLDNDGDLDMVVGGANPYKYTGDTELAYYQNEGSAVFAKQDGLDSPFGGVDVGNEAAPFLVDVDGDTDLDAVIGPEASLTNLVVFVNQGNKFKEDPSHPIQQIPIATDNIKPVFVDIDDDGDNDIFIALDDEVIFSRNISGTYVTETSPIDVSGLTIGTEYSLAFADVDGDGDFDAFLGNDGNSPAPALIQYMRNDGTKAIPNFVVSTAPAPFNTISFEHTPNVFSEDIDHDGDYDIVVAESVYDAVLLNDITLYRLFQNNGDQTFTEVNLPISTAKKSPNHGYISLADIDGDGDLDVFLGFGDDLYGNESGTVGFLQNQNPAPMTTVNSGPFVYIFGSGPAVVDATISIADTDSDQIVRAVIVIQGFDPGDVLNFTPQGNVSGIFDPSDGTLTLSGLASIATYESVLRSITYDFTGPQPTSSGRKGGPSGRTVVVNKTFEFTVFDADFTTPITQTLAVQLTVPNVLPAVTTSSGVSVFAGSPIIIDATIAVSDADDADLFGATVQISPSSLVASEDVLLFTDQNGITGSFNNATGVLTLTGVASVADYQIALRSIQYQNTSGTPTASSRTIEFMVDDGESLSSMVSKSLTINIPSPPMNVAPIITASSLNTVINNSVTIDLSTIISDPDGNLDPLSFRVIPNVSPTPARVGNATIVNSVLTVDYFGTDFVGTDFVTIEACDLGALCATAEITIQVAGEIIVRNGISPNGDGLNDFFKIDNITSLGAQNKVSIFTRWGDKVFEIEDYNNQDRKFEGKTDSGKELSSGIYFYKIEFSNGEPKLSGYLTIKR